MTESWKEKEDREWKERTIERAKQLSRSDIHARFGATFAKLDSLHKDARAYMRNPSNVNAAILRQHLEDLDEFLPRMKNSMYSISLPKEES